jgi:preprotein translocase subunit SecE
VRDVASFAVDSCRLMAHVSKPSPSETFKTAVVVLVVVALFVGLLHASNVGLLAVRSVGSHLLHHLR